ncbi:unnamed protein product [Staurois parvus]|uniref:Uncharacterized protein n=1 Tax=Staurois parvus TaxID=386267 RepID=A0ABN9FPW7_9NEOB|nr:unnamed protein product [Staurois parvus]
MTISHSSGKVFLFFTSSPHHSRRSGTPTMTQRRTFTDQQSPTCAGSL